MLINNTDYWILKIIYSIPTRHQNASVCICYNIPKSDKKSCKYTLFPAYTNTGIDIFSHISRFIKETDTFEE